jgi:hypothetical protein
MCSYRVLSRIHDRIDAAKRGELVTESGKNLPALLDTYEQHKLRNDAFMEKTIGKAVQKKSKLSNLHSKGAADGTEAGNKIGLDQQVGQKETRMIK